MRKKLDFEEDEQELRRLLEDLNAVGRLAENNFINYSTYLQIRKEVMSYIGERLISNLFKGRKSKIKSK
jgi:hypothetical protein